MKRVLIIQNLFDNGTKQRYRAEEKTPKIGLLKKTINLQRSDKHTAKN